MVDPIFSPSDYHFVMNDLKDGPNLEDISVGQLLGPLQEQVYNPNEANTYENMVPYDESKPAAKKRKTSNSNMCDSTNNPLPQPLPSTSNNVEELPCLTEFSGHFDFQLFLPNEVCTPHRWTYSPALKKVFIDIEKVLALQFKWNYYELKPDVQLFIRALPVYTLPDHMKDPVIRCPLHVLPDNPTNVGFPYLHHIIRCEHTATRYDRDEKGRYSCVTPLTYPQPGSDTTTLTYKFVCKTSCPSGMDRKAISIIYTLEDVNGNVFGRQPLAVKICSCPKRDKAKEEQQLVNEKKVSARNPRSRSTGGSLSVRASKTPNNEQLKDLQYDTEASNTSSVGCKRITKKSVIAQKKVIANNEFSNIASDVREIKEILTNRRVDTVQAFGDAVVKELRDLSPQHMYEMMANIHKTMTNFKAMVNNPCLTPAPSVASPESVDYESMRNQQNTTPFSYRNNWNTS